MAAALAATLPTAPAAPQPVAPTYEAIPASMSKLIDVEAEIPLTEVQLDGMVRVNPPISQLLAQVHLARQVVSKIMKHAAESTTPNANGLLLGLDLDGTLEVSNSFALPAHLSDEDDKANKSMGTSISYATSTSLMRRSTVSGIHDSLLEGGARR